MREPAAKVGAVVFIAIALLVGLIGAIDRGIDNDPDWRDLQFETRWTWQHGHTAPGTAMFGYLPATTFALLPFAAWIPAPLGVLLYIATNCAALAITLRLLQQWRRAGDARGAVLVAPVALAAVNLAHALQSNQTTLWTLALCVGGLTLLHTARPTAGGFLIGSAAMIKVMPGLLVIYLLLRAQWRAVGGFLAAVVLINVVPSVLFFGVDGALAEHRLWLQRAAWHSNERMIEDPLLRVHRHGTNSALSTVLTRWLRALPDARRQVILYGSPPPDVVERYRAALAADEVLTLDPMPPHDGADWAEKRVDLSWVPRFHMADLPAGVVRWLWAAPLLIAFAALFWWTWRTRRAAPQDWPAISSLWMLMMFWPSPMLRHYYLAWALPALVVVCNELLDGRPNAALARRWAIAAVVAWAIATLAMGSKELRWYGIHVFALALLTIASAQAWSMSLRRGQTAAGARP